MRVKGLHIRDYAKGCNNCGHTRPQMSTKNVTGQISFERLYLVPRKGTFGPWVNCPYAPTTPTVQATQLFLDFREIFFPERPLISVIHDYLRGGERSDQESVVHEKIALSHEQNWPLIKSTSARGVARTSAKRFGDPAQRIFFRFFCSPSHHSYIQRFSENVPTFRRAGLPFTSMET